jgi:hypothetical protein
VAAASAAPAPIVSAAATSPEASARALAAAWTKALNAADTQALGPLYADRVQFYGREMSNGAVVAAKARALASAKTYQQSIVGEVAVEPAGDGSLVLHFDKRSGPAGRLRDVRAKLVVIRGDGGALVIHEETDEPSEKRAASKNRAACHEIAERAVSSLPQVKRALADIERDVAASGGRARSGGIGPLDEDDGGFSGGYGVHTDQRYEARVWYAVDAHGKLSVTILADDIPVPPDTQRKVHEACAS